MQEIYRDEGPVSLEEIEAFERKLGIAFPSSYKRLIAQYNGLRPRANIFDVLEDGFWDTRDVNFLAYGTARELPSGLSEIERRQDHDVYGHDRIVAFAETANGDLVCFDYRGREDDKPGVVLMLHDDIGPDEKLKLIPVAETFEDFMNGLHR